LADDLGDEAHVALDIGDGGFGLELDDAVAEAPQHRARERARIGAGEHEVGREFQKLLGRPVIQSVARGFLRQQRFFGIGGEPADGQDLLGIRDREKVLIGAQIDRSDAR
jgi:hypothetical protein